MGMTDMPSRRKALPRSILVLGGGVGGLITATTLRKKLGKEHRIAIVDREETHLFAPSLLWLMTGDRSARQIVRPLERLSRKGIEVVRGTIERIEPDTRRVTVDDRELRGDFLVIALGADLAPHTIPGLAESGHNFYTLGGAESFRDALARFEKGKLVVLTGGPAYKCPAAPYEAALLIDHALRERGHRETVSVEVYAAEPGPMGVAGPEVSGAVRQMLQARGIPYHPEHQIKVVDSVAKRLQFSNGATAEFDLLAYVPPHRAPRVVRESGLSGESGWISVDRHTLETRVPGVWAVGDVVSIPLKLGKPLPKAGVFAHAQADVVARNIAAAVTGRAQNARFDGRGQCFVEIGDGKAAFGDGNFYAEPLPGVKLRAPSRRWHLGKVLFEKSWLYTRL
jgi:sulfide:quinone oxidoreductase